MDNRPVAPLIKDQPGGMGSGLALAAAGPSPAINLEVDGGYPRKSPTTSARPPLTVVFSSFGNFRLREELNGPDQLPTARTRCAA